MKNGVAYKKQRVHKKVFMDVLRDEMTSWPYSVTQKKFYGGFTRRNVITAISNQPWCRLE